MQEPLKDAASHFRAGWRTRYFAGEPLRIGDETQFLFDDYMVEDRFGLKRVQGPVEKFAGNPLDAGPDMPWESYKPVMSHVLYDPQEKRWKAWYGTMRWQEGVESGYNYSTCYAESEDGIRWEKPPLGLFAWGEHKDTNLVIHKEKGTAAFKGNVCLDPAPADPGRRFWGLAKMVPPGEDVRCLVLMHSTDGREWRLAPDPVLFRGASDGSYCLVQDLDGGGWLLYRRPPTHAMKAEGFYEGANTKRKVSVCTSQDMKRWTHPRTVALPDEADLSDIDCVSVIRRGNLYIGFIGLMANNSPDFPKSTHLTWSRDGFSWERLPDRAPFIPNGAPGEWDEGSVSFGTLIPEGDRFRIYYRGVNVPQFEKRLPSITGTGMAFMGKDRFVGQQAGAEGGYLLTRQFLLEGDRLEVNCRAAAHRPPSPELGPLLKAELLQPAQDHFPALPYPGYSMDDCDPVVVTDSYGQGLSWNGSPDLSPLRGKVVYVRFFLRNATLYTLRAFAGGGA